jgi:uncharacterized protein YkwD
MTDRQRPARVHRRTVSSAIVAGAVLVGVASLPQASAAPSVAPSVAPSAPVLETRSSHRIDRTSRTSVRNAYLDRFVPAVQTPTGWTGSTATCEVGTESAASRRATRDAVNFYRAMVGIGPVTLDKEWSTKALRAALMMDAADALDHYPGSSWPCSSSDGITAAGRSNLFWSSCCSGAVSVPAYIIDDGSSNAPVGHRRWLLNPEISRIGVGSTSQANAIWVVPEAGDPGTSGPSWIAWPPAGHVPMPLVVGTDASGAHKTLGRWSLSTRSTVDADFSQATVQARLSSGTRLDTTIEHRAANSNRFGSALVWNVSRPTGAFSITKPVTVRISVRNIRVGNSTVSKSYSVRLFPVFPPAVPATSLSAHDGRLDVSWSAAQERGAPVTGYTVRVYADNPYTTAPIATRRVTAQDRSVRVGVTSGRHYYAFVFAESEAGRSATPSTAFSSYVP